MVDMIESLSKNQKSERHAKRRKPRKLGCVIGLIVLVLFLAAVGLTIGYIMSFNDVNLAETVEVNIPEGASSKQIAKILEENDVVKSAFSFGMSLKQKDVATKLRPGNFSFGPGAVSHDDVIEVLLKGGGNNEKTMNITIPEGLTVEQEAYLLAKKGVVDKQEFLDYAANLEIPYDYIPKGTDYNQLEGFLYPETYNILKTWGAKEIIDMQLKQFNKVFKDEWKEQAKALDMSIYEVVNLASIIEREALFNVDRPVISGVFHKRLAKPMRLQSCATVQYILGEQKAVLTNADISIPSPYNTYQNDGLPPTPISSPGASSLEAALYPEQNDYYYFLAMPDGHHYFSETYDEHVAAKAKYIDGK